MNARFYAPDAHTPGDLVSLPEEEGQHLTRVLRLKSGDPVRVFNGRGLEFDGIVERPAKGAVGVRVASARAAAPEPRVAITLVQAVLKGDKMDDVVRDAVMLGAAAIVPVVTSRSEVSLAALGRGRRHERWQRIAISSAKQCGRAVVPDVMAARAFDGVPASITALELPGPALMLVEPGAAADTLPFGEIDLPVPAQATMIVGPEGGWTADEVQACGAACRLVSLGARTLRADAAAIVALAAAFTLWKEF